MIKLQFDTEVSGAENYINTQLEDCHMRSRNNIHIVFDGAGVSWGFYLEAFKVLKEFLFRINNDISLRLYRNLREQILSEVKDSSNE
jgi:hypothetical protein